MVLEARSQISTCQREHSFRRLWEKSVLCFSPSFWPSLGFLGLHHIIPISGSTVVDPSPHVSMHGLPIRKSLIRKFLIQSWPHLNYPQRLFPNKVTFWYSRWSWNQGLGNTAESGTETMSRTSDAVRFMFLSYLWATHSSILLHCI